MTDAERQKRYRLRRKAADIAAEQLKQYLDTVEREAEYQRRRSQRMAEAKARMGW